MKHWGSRCDNRQSNTRRRYPGYDGRNGKGPCSYLLQVNGNGFLRTYAVFVHDMLGLRSINTNNFPNSVLGAEGCHIDSILTFRLWRNMLKTIWSMWSKQPRIYCVQHDCIERFWLTDFDWTFHQPLSWQQIPLSQCCWSLDASKSATAFSTSSW